MKKIPCSNMQRSRFKILASVFLFFIGCEFITDFEPPDIEIVTPSRGSSIQEGAMTIAVNVADKNFSRAEIRGDGALLCKVESEGNSTCEWQIFYNPNSSNQHTIKVTAFDKGGNWAEKDSHFEVYPSATISEEVIIFSSNGDLWRVKPDGSGLQRITFDGGGKNGPSISPDGSRFAFSKSESGRNSLWVMDSNGSNPRLLFSNGGGKTSWSPSGSEIAYILTNYCNENIGVAKSDGSSSISFIDDSVPTLGPVTHYVDWSSTNVIAFNSFTCGLDCSTSVIYTINRDKTGQQEIGTGGGYPNWSPDGSKIVYHLCGNIYVKNADGSNSKLLTSNGYNPCWSPDGTRIAFMRNDNLWTMNADGFNEQQITSGSFPDAQPDWGIIR